MKLSGKCLADFEEWVRRTQDWENHWVEWDGFEDLPEAMKFGVIVDFADSIDIEMMTFKDMKGIWLFHISIKESAMEYGNFKDRPEARREAVKKFNEIYNP